MDANYNEIMSIKIMRTLDNLQKNNMEACYVNNCADVVQRVKELCPEGSTVACGGSMTLIETGVMDLLQNGKYQFLDCKAPGADADAVMRQAFSCDTYFMSSNAITQEGELYNVDGSSNRTAALLFGPRNVIVVAGYNKIVRNLNAAVHRVRDVAAPVNAQRLERSTPCVKMGTCCDCRSDERICCNYVVSAYQRIQGRIKVILVGEQLGY